MTDKTNKFDLLNKVSISDLKAEDKALLTELILRMDDKGECFPSVERLCKARGIKHEKNFKGADVYLPGLVTKVKRGRKNRYIVNTPAVAGLSEAEVTLKQSGISNGTPAKAANTPAVEGVNTPALEGVNTPAVAGLYTPAVEGANTSKDSSGNSSKETSKNSSKKATPPPVLSFEEEDTPQGENIPISILNLNPSFEEIVTPLLDNKVFSLAVPDDSAQDPAHEAAPVLSRETIKSIEEQVRDIAETERWETDLTQSVLTLALDPFFLEGKGSAGTRIARAKQNATQTQHAW